MTRASAKLAVTVLPSATALALAALLASALPPCAAESKLPPKAAQAPAMRQNCGTAWTGWTEDPNTNINPCPKGCERGERELVKTYQQGDKMLADQRLFTAG